MDEFAQIRNAINHFLPLDEEEWKGMATKFLLKKFNKGDFLTRQGQIEQYIYFLHQGATRNYFTRDGKDFTVDFHFAGEFVTGYYSLITREPSEVFIEALLDIEAVAIDYGSLQEFYNSAHHGDKLGRLIAEYQYVKRIRKEMELLSLTAEERYASLLQKNPALVQDVSVKHLSSYLGIQPESLSRIRKLYARN
jgi:CRP/FNR family transcriptional regulator, anaerobic regulatory protein